MELIVIIVSLICLLLFIGMAMNIWVIKKAICDRSFSSNELSSKEYYNMYLEEKYIDNTGKARENLMRACYKVESDDSLSEKKKEEFIDQCKEELRDL